MPPDPEVPEKPKRRRFTAEYKLWVIEQADAARDPGEVGALLRREGLYSSHLAEWRKQRRQGSLAGLSTACLEPIYDAVTDRFGTVDKNLARHRAQARLGTAIGRPEAA